ncbi:uncharacterized protein B0H18DRAFT_1123505 [Fomitopsis serialis]|uniref:uncharacterized protein n=1 Tax=Fomitopsis serialis TaxID=139415 RepID=UPI002007B4AF|nr:uncharacterized protein B0H18DRAFT_1123505 [Neoantrodia serialis]KAH9917628.1 hypothetical protein B0H18DRAFT_1123505 [Neoantrodia serialis]
MPHYKPSRIDGLAERQRTEQARQLELAEHEPREPEPGEDECEEGKPSTMGTTHAGTTAPAAPTRVSTAHAGPGMTQTSATGEKQRASININKANTIRAGQYDQDVYNTYNPSKCQPNKRKLIKQSAAADKPAVQVSEDRIASWMDRELIGSVQARVGIAERSSPRTLPAGARPNAEGFDLL